MADAKDYYKLLGVSPAADDETIKSAYRKLARLYHPDLNNGNAQAEETFKQINEAYDILGDKEKKRQYDLRQKAAQKLPQKGSVKNQTTPGKTSPGAKHPDPQKPPSPKPSSPPPFNEFVDSLLKARFKSKPASEETANGQAGPTIFEGKPGQAKASPTASERKRGVDVEVATPMSVSEAAQGVVKTVNVQHNDICKRCAGTGKVNGLACNVCQGDGIIVKLKKMDVRIPAGVKDGSKVRVAGEGGRGSGGGENGDLYLIVQVSTDPDLRIEGVHVYSTLSISIPTAVLGGEVDVPTLNGTVKMTIPPLTSSGKVLRLKGVGVQSEQGIGDQFVTVTITCPEQLSPRQRELYEALAKLD